MMHEKDIEQMALDELRELGWQVAFGPDISPEGTSPERDAYHEVVLKGRLREALERINPHLPPVAIEEAVRRILTQEHPALIENNRAFHRMLTEGVDVSWMDSKGERYGKVWLLDTDRPENNDWLAVNQFTVVEHKRERRPDIVLFVNGLPLVVIELKNPADDRATIQTAFNQLQTYKAQIPSLFVYNELLVVSDGALARFGTITSGWDRFMPWRTITGKDLYRELDNDRQKEGIMQPGLLTLIRGMFEHNRFLDYCLNFITFEEPQKGTDAILKKAAAYHQYHAVNQAVASTLIACGFTENSTVSPSGEHLLHTEPGSKRAGVIWHTQGSGKSLSMVFYAAKLIRHPAMENPTIVVITDRNDLDKQLFGTFKANRQILRQSPEQAKNRSNLKELLQVASGGIVFTTIQKFFPESKGASYPLLSKRRNIVVIADEAHRSQYDFIDGFARHMRDALPNASFIGFTGTPIEKDDKNTRAVFGDYISIYDIQRAVEDGATVPIYYESRLAKIELDEAQKPLLDEEFEEITESEEDEAYKHKLKTKWASLEALVGAEKRVRLVAEDIVKHWEQRQDAIKGKGMIVCMSRRICVDMYNAITDIHPEWHSDDDNKGKIKVVMTGSASDPVEWQPHIRDKKRRDQIASRLKNPDDELELVIVRDMWLTGFDVPALHTMYIDKPMSGHNLMQAIARVNRVFKDKPGGLVVDYLGIAQSLKRALAVYAESGGRGSTAIDQDEAAALMQEKYEVVRGILHGFDYVPLLSAPTKERLSGALKAIDFILGQKDGKKRYLQAVTALSKAFALAVPHETALAIRDEVGLFQEIRALLIKTTVSSAERSPADLEAAVRQLVSKAISGREVVDIFAAVGLDKPDISILSDEFMAEVRAVPQKNLAVETLRKLLLDEISVRMRKNVVQSRAFSEMLEKTMNRYHNRSIEAAQVIEELISIAKQMRKAALRGEELGLSEDEVAFYDALASNESAVNVLGDETLKRIAQELVERVRSSVTVDWNRRESARAKLRRLVKRTLRKYGYPPDKQEQATNLVLEQTEVLCSSD